MREAKVSHFVKDHVIFKLYSGGVKTNRDAWAYDFNKNVLEGKMLRFIDTYNGEIDRWRRRSNSSITVDNFVTYDDSKIKWSSSLKAEVLRLQYVDFTKDKIRKALYRPFCKEWLFLERIFIERVYQFPQILPIPEAENVVICVSAIGSNKLFHCLATDVIPDMHLTGDTQCFPYYTYAGDGSNRRENITDWALGQFQARYGAEVTKWDIFQYVYGILHHPQYRERYAENLKRDLPHIPLLNRKEAFQLCVRVGRELMHLHLHYEQAQEDQKVELLENRDVPFSWRVEKMRLSTDRRVVVVNESLRLGPIPPECFAYRLGNRSALEWVLDQYQVSEDKRSGIVSDPNRIGDEEDYIVRLLRRVVTVSVETVRLVNELAQGVMMADWMDEGGGEG